MDILAASKTTTREENRADLLRERKRDNVYVRERERERESICGAISED